MEVIFILNEKEYNFFNSIDGKDQDDIVNNKTDYLADKVLDKNYVFDTKIPGYNNLFDGCRLRVFYNNDSIFNLTLQGNNDFKNLHSKYDVKLIEEIEVTENIEKFNLSHYNIDCVKEIICDSLKNKKDEELITNFFNDKSTKKELHLMLDTSQKARYVLNKNHKM